MKCPLVLIHVESSYSTRDNDWCGQIGCRGCEGEEEDTERMVWSVVWCGVQTGELSSSKVMTELGEPPVLQTSGHCEETGE